IALLRLLPMRTAILLALFCVTSVSAQIDPRTALVERAAWDALSNGRAHEAAVAFRDALTSDPRNPRLHLGAGLAAMAERRDADARDEFEAALALDPKLVPARAQLGVVQYRLGDVPSAIRTYETLVADAPGDPDARATLDRWRREQELHDRMRDAIDSPFTPS